MTNLRFRRSEIRKRLGYALCCASSLVLAHCTVGPLADVSSLSPAIQGDTLGDNAAFSDVQDQILLTNILRARDGAPLNIGMLASINGALSLSGTAGFTFPFGKYPSGGSFSAGLTDTFAPSVTGGTTPTYTFTPLNTQGFNLNVVQPVTASYVLSRWNAGVSHGLLLFLFAKAIDFPVQVEVKVQVTIKKKKTTLVRKVVHYVRFVNDPDNPDQFLAFRRLVHSFLLADAELKSFDVLDPVGPAFDMYSPLSLPSVTKGTGANARSSSPSMDNDKAVPLQPNATSFGEITGNSDAQYHFGNIYNYKHNPNRKGRDWQGQLYRVYAGQVALCVNADRLSDYPVPAPESVTAPPPPPPPAVVPNPPVPPVGKAAPSPKAPPKSKLLANIPPIGQSLAQQTHLYSAQYLSASISGAPVSTGKTGTGSPAASAATGTSASAATMAALQAQRFSSIVNDQECGTEQIVLDQSSETDFETASQGFPHIQWRSIAEMFEYLGAVLRYNQNNVPIRWWEPPSSWIAFGSQTPDLVGTGDAAGCEQDGSNDCKYLTLFDVSPGLAKPSVFYGGLPYHVAGPGQNETDQSMQALSMLGLLVNLANVSGGTAPSVPLQLLPLP